MYFNTSNKTIAKWKSKGMTLLCFIDLFNNKKNNVRNFILQTKK